MPRELEELEETARPGVWQASCAVGGCEHPNRGPVVSGDAEGLRRFVLLHYFEEHPHRLSAGDLEELFSPLELQAMRENGELARKGLA